MAQNASQAAESPGKDATGLERVSFTSAATYTFLEEVGRGGMGVVLLAEKTCAGVSDLVALKTIRTASKEHADILVREANLATRLRHENIVKTYGLEMLPLSVLPPEVRLSFEVAAEPGTEREEGSEAALRSGATPIPGRRRILGRRRGRGRPAPRRGPEIDLRTTQSSEDDPTLLLIAMDYVEGTDVLRLHNAHLKAGYLLPPLLIAFILTRVSRALDYAHNFVVHRDLSPENILVDNQGVCKLTDFGIAVAAKEGKIKWGGKLGYMAPEQFASKPVDERADIYSLGLVGYTLLTGIPLQAPPKRGTLKERMSAVRRQMEEGFPPAHRVMGDIPKVFSDILGKMISPDPGDRYLRAAHVANELERTFLFAKGYGPTANSLAAYMDIFESGFTKYDEEQIEQLAFLRNEGGGLALKRHLSMDMYTRVGRELISERTQYYIYRRLAELESERARVQASKPQSQLVLKVRLMDNVVVTWPLDRAFTLGADPSNDIRLIGRAVAKRHAELDPEGPTLRAIGKARLRCNGLSVNEIRLQEGDQLAVGTVRLYCLQDPILKSPGTSAELGDGEPDPALATKATFELKLPPAEAGRLFDFWHDLAHQVGLGEQKRLLLANALVEAVNLIAEGELPVTIATYQEPNRLRFVISCAASRKGFDRMTAEIHEHKVTPLPLGNPRLLAFSMVFKTFERLDIGMQRQTLTLVKTY